MLNTKRSRVRALAGIGMAAVVAGIGTVTFNASAAETAPVAPAAVGADARAVSIPGIAAAIKPPKGSRPIGAYVVTDGTQNYTCVVAAGAATGGYTAGSTPEAQLVGTGGRIHHFGGPSWQSLRDKSLVTATKTAAVDKAGTIPELLLTINSHTGTGILGKADFISRLRTSGGVAPAGTCTAGQVVKVKYGAVYVFWDAPAAA
ncbi:DUF3455 domain-containing protein [Actinoplanes derwentensis]|uniref:Tat (Twin-arginine translocation) pathway signal sequence n=1 Tax=Actinoplanes derwentensis TaxID=113562 RepID=A0A1H2CID7_9ACTN|nr:DUF3455 domain-containing protein [Actinoplanes derwentensis]GID90044.1 hypothetical protein Ade03nite_89680 [Actinoplanes derwentensis]SDT70243.1 Protein of unknown function [Actinoplanes derwentensis]